MRYFVKISYDGSGFNGFQRLKKLRTVQSELERVLSIINKKPVIVKGAGRTDKGVHAYGQCAHFDLDVNVPIKRLHNALNRNLASDVRIVLCKVVNDDFHARFDVKKKKYVYKINLGEYDPLKSNYYYQVGGKLDLKRMKKCSKYFLGVHDFRNFVSGVRDNYDAIIYSIQFKKKKDILEIEFIGKSFYRYMVRNLVGALVLVGMFKCDIEGVKSMIDTPLKRKQMLCAPACGLYLMDIKY